MREPNPKKVTELGHCYEDVFKFIQEMSISSDDEDVHIVHGKFRNIDGKLIDHAWVKISPKSSNPKVWDPEARCIIDGEVYYKRVAVVNGEYTILQAFRLMAHYGYGPWTPQEVAAQKS
jgi:hypothetical protein